MRGPTISEIAQVLADVVNTIEAKGHSPNDLNTLHAILDLLEIDDGTASLLMLIIVEQFYNRLRVALAAKSALSEEFGATA